MNQHQHPALNGNGGPLPATMIEQLDWRLLHEHVERALFNQPVKNRSELVRLANTEPGIEYHVGGLHTDGYIVATLGGRALLKLHWSNLIPAQPRA